MFTSLGKPCVSKRLGRQCGHAVGHALYHRSGEHILKVWGVGSNAVALAAQRATLIEDELI
jgi:hypothetical protein